MAHQYPHDDWKTPRHTSRGIVIKDGSILLIERWRKGQHYFSFPGGGIEKDESPENTVKREIFEETSIRAEVEKKLYEMQGPIGHVHTIFLCKYEIGEPSLQTDSEEAQSMKANGKEDTYIPKWVATEKIDSLPFLYWQPIANQLIKDLKQGWPQKPIDISAVQ